MVIIEPTFSLPKLAQTLYSLHGRELRLQVIHHVLPPLFNLIPEKKTKLDGTELKHPGRPTGKKYDP